MSIVWLNGTLLDAATARIDPADRGLTLGDGLFETMRVENEIPADAARHFARLRQGATVLGIAVPFGDDALFDALCMVARENGLHEAALRLTLTRGPAARGLLPGRGGQPTMLMTAAPLPPAAAPARVIIARRTRRNEFSPLSRIKSLNYLDGVLARLEAAAAGADDALLLNTQGQVAEATAANVFFRMNGRWVTPPVEDGALPGIARAMLLQASTAKEESLTEAALARVDAGFLTTSLGQRPIGELLGRALAICESLQK